MTAQVAGGGPRALLRRLHEIMAAPRSAQARLDRVVKVIAANMVAEVCSVYLMRAGQVLELFATEGLNPEAVHRTRLRVGEGLVGRIAAYAQPLNLSNAQGHPDFAYRPETGEEIYHSLLGVPVLHAGRVIGVLVVQNRTRRQYDEEEVEALQTIAMVLSELVRAGALIPPDELHEPGGNATLARRIDGIRFANGLAIGQAVLHQPQIVVRRVIAEDPACERERLDEAVAALRRSVDRMIEVHDAGGGGEHLDVLAAYRMFAEDRGWLTRIGEAIGAGLTAEAAVQRVQEDTRARLDPAADAYLRERLLDLDDLAGRLLRHLSGEAVRAADDALPAAFVLVAHTMGPAELLEYPRDRLRGVVLEEGSPTAHVAIVARALDVPLVGQAKGALNEIDDGDTVIVDGESAGVYVRPSGDVIEAYEESLEASAARRATYAAMRDLPAITLDGERVALNVNTGLPVELIDLADNGADGVGLYRTEMPFMIGSGIPDTAQQAALYRRVLDQVGERPVVFRTLDIGGDKRMPNFAHADEANPALGWRSLRLVLDRPALLRRQLRALLRAAAGRELRVMFPMVTEVAEFDAARALLARECERATARGETLPAALRVGAMFEVPGLAWQLPALLDRVDFLSVGSNDLMQFMFASDRGNPRLLGRYDPLSPAMLALMRDLIAKCAAAGVDLALCGEMAGRPLEAMVLVGLGLRSLSMSPSAIGPIKCLVRSLEVGALNDYLNTLCDLPDHSLRDRIHGYAKDHGVLI
ncbi:MAG: phosphoenolpyruvate--protein phosphotransferase [Alphaproteobacteria bacterium]